MSKTVITAKVTDQTVQLVNLPLLSSGSVGAVQIRCEFCSLWDGYVKTAVFYRQGGPVYHINMTDDTTDIPWEVLTEKGTIHFGIMGVAENTRTTAVVQLQIEQGAITTAAIPSAEPTPDIYTQLLTSLAVDRARLDALVAMEASNGTTEHALSSEYISGTITTNGASAYITLAIRGLTLDAGAFYYCEDCIPVELTPLAPGVKLQSTSQDITVEIWTEDGQSKVVVYNLSGTNYTPEKFATLGFTAEYSLAAVYLAELADMRVGPDGTTHNTAGAALRAAANTAATAQSQVLQMADRHVVETNKAGVLNYSYPFKAGRTYQLTNHSAGYVTVRIKDASGTDVNTLTLNKEGEVATFTAAADAVTLYLFFQKVGSVILEDPSLRMPVIEEEVATLHAEAENINHLLLTGDADAPCVVAEAAGVKYLEYRVSAGHTYRFTKNSTKYVTIKTMTAAQKAANKGEYVDALELGDTGVIKTFTATGNADIIQLYFGAAGSMLVENLSLRIPALENEVAALQRKKEPGLTWSAGSLSIYSGKESASTTTIRTGFIPVTGYGGTVIFNGVGRFAVYEYASNDARSNLLSRNIDGNGWTNHAYKIERDECKFIRIIAQNAARSAFADQEEIDAFGGYFKFVQSSFTRRAPGRYVSPVKEEFHYGGDILPYVPNYNPTEENSDLKEVYTLWEGLQAAHPNIISAPTVLGTIGGKEIRSYRITPTQMRPDYYNARYSCEPLKILYVSCVHGGEGAIALDDFAFFKNLVENHKPRVLWDNCVFEVIPVANPVGYDNHTRLNENNVNLNRNFPAGWSFVPYADITDADGNVLVEGNDYNVSTRTPESYDPNKDPSEYHVIEPGTQILMDFVKSHPDAFLVINRHGTNDWADGGIAGYASGKFQADIETIIASGTATDSMLRGMEAYAATIAAKCPSNRIFSVLHTEKFQGSFDMWFTSTGHHGYLMEYCDRFKGESAANDTVRKINITAIANLLIDSVLNNREIIGNDNALDCIDVVP